MRYPQVTYKCCTNINEGLEHLQVWQSIEIQAPTPSLEYWIMNIIRKRRMKEENMLSTWNHWRWIMRVMDVYWPQMRWENRWGAQNCRQKGNFIFQTRSSWPIGAHCALVICPSSSSTIWVELRPNNAKEVLLLFKQYAFFIPNWPVL